jgi:hypothetical protein
MLPDEDLLASGSNKSPVVFFDEQPHAAINKQIGIASILL